MRNDEFDLDIIEITDETDELEALVDRSADQVDSAKVKTVGAKQLVIAACVLAIVVVGVVFAILNHGYKVTFDTQGGSEVIVDAKRRYDKGEKVDTVQYPYREGYLFTGWYTDPSCEEEFAWNMEQDTVTGDMTLYAGWIGMISQDEMQQPITGSPLINP